MTHARAKSLNSGVLDGLGSSIHNYMGQHRAHWIPANMWACHEISCWHSQMNSEVPANSKTDAELLNIWTFRSSAEIADHISSVMDFQGTTVPEWEPDAELIRGEVAGLFHSGEKPPLLVVDRAFIAVP